MNALSTAVKSLWAKKSAEGELLWLPLTVHLADAAETAKILWHRWLSGGVRNLIAGDIGDEQKAKRLFVFLAAAHDIGKATPVFQAKESHPPNRDLDERLTERLQISGLPVKPYREFSHANKTPHALATQILLENAGCDKAAASILGAHHGKPQSKGYKRCCPKTYSGNYHMEEEGEIVWAQVQNELIAFALDMAGFASLKEMPPPGIGAQVLLSALVITADWIASNESHFPLQGLDDDSVPNSNIRAERAWERLKLPGVWEPTNAWMGDLFKERFGFDPNAVQKAAQSAADIAKPGIFVLEAPMGVGKTEAALAAAEIFAAKTKRTGVFFALPTQATSDGIFPRIQSWLEKLTKEAGENFSVRLAHGKAQFNPLYQTLFEGGSNISVDEEEREEGRAVVHDWFEGPKKALLANFVVGTVDQLLLAALKQRHVMLRHLGLANKVVIIDEVHAYDAYMSQYLEMALRWLGAYSVPVIVLSATLPPERRQALINAYLRDDRRERRPWAENGAYPMITRTNGGEVEQQEIPTDGASREVRLMCMEETLLADRLEELLSDGGCAGVVVNTVKRAQEIAACLRERLRPETVQLLHSRFLSPDRAKNEQRLLSELGKPSAETKRPSKRVIVGTQVIEQSLDVDFDLMVTDICPMDLLLQRIGRLHRHDRQRPEKLQTAVCFVMDTADDEGTRFIYSEYMLARTKALMPERLRLPEDISGLVREAYELSETSPGYEEWKKRVESKKKRAKDFRIDEPWPDGNILGWLDRDVPDRDGKRGEAAVRDTDESIEVLMIQEIDGKYYFLPWIEIENREIPSDAPPDNETARMLACQSIRLPSGLCAPWRIEKTIQELECIVKNRFPAWQKSHWLAGSLFLVLDSQFSAQLGGYRLQYDRYVGLTHVKEGDDTG